MKKPPLLLIFLFAAPLASVSAQSVSDLDQDGIPDSADNCILLSNPSQFDADLDGFGNRCDTDLNNDCVVNFTDLALLRQEFLGDDLAADFNEDGVVNFSDLGVFRQFFLTAPGPSSLPNNCAADIECASYQNSAGQTISGTGAGQHCIYPPSFVDAGNSLATDLTITALPDDGAHIFEGSLLVGESFDTDADLATAGITQGGDGPTLTIEAGATLAWPSESDFVVINRGSRIFAVGRADAPITFTSLSDLTNSLPSYDAGRQWGGIVINGFGVTNKCAYSGTVAADDLATTECHIDAEGAAGLEDSKYGGDNNDDSSGRLEYVVVKHTGGTVTNGDMLSAISFGGVGRNTVVSHLEVYSAFEDGIELFGGAVNLSNFVGLYVRDDAIDIDEGYSGTIQDALVIQNETTGHLCVEGDGIGSFADFPPDFVEEIISQGINSRPVINNLTCILSPSPADGDFDSGAGLRLREGIFPTISDSLIVSSFGIDSGDSNYCLRIDDRSRQAAQDGALAINSTIFACEERTRNGMLPDGTTVEQFVIANGNIFATLAGQTDPTAAADTELQLFDGEPPVFSIDYNAMRVDGSMPTGAPQNGAFVGAASSSEPDWLAGWTFGINEGARDAPLWIE